MVACATEEGPDLDSVAFFEMSSASAEQVTLQIQSMMERAWEYIAIAYQGRLALGYASWDKYVDDRLGDLRLTVPREHRGAVVQSLSNAQMSLRANAKVLGVSVATAHRAGTCEQDDDEQTELQGRDGWQYRKRRKMKPACTICGEHHDEPPDECPWDLFAQGRGPRPGSNERQSGADLGTDSRSEGPADREPPIAVDESVDASRIVDSVTRAVCIVDETGSLPELVDDIEGTGLLAGGVELVRGVRELIEHLRYQAQAIACLADRLEQLTPNA